MCDARSRRRFHRWCEGHLRTPHSRGRSKKKEGGPVLGAAHEDLDVLNAYAASRLMPMFEPWGWIGETGAYWFACHGVVKGTL
jgi:hypothetical protein